MATSKQKLVKFLKEAGVSYIRVRGDWERLGDDQDFYEAPFTGGIGVNWKTRSIYDSRANRPWPEILHEAGHLLASKVNPKESSAYDFLGWEICVAQKLGLPMGEWWRNNNPYSIIFRSEDRYYICVGDLPFDSQDFLDFVKERIERSRSLGLLQGLE